MKPAADAVLVDSTGMTVAEVVETLARDIEARIGRPAAVAVGGAEGAS